MAAESQFAEDFGFELDVGVIPQHHNYPDYTRLLSSII